VFTCEENPAISVFYEVYNDAEALEAHRETPHFKKFAKVTKDLIAERDVERCMLIS